MYVIFSILNNTDVISAMNTSDVAHQVIFCIDLKFEFQLGTLKTHQFICMLGFISLCFILPVYLCYNSFIDQTYLCRELRRGQFSQRHSEILKENTKIHRKIISENIKGFKLTDNAKKSIKIEMIKKVLLRLCVRM